MKRKGPGRPPLPISQKTSELVSLRLTKSEHRQLKRMARSQLLSVSKFIRQNLFG